MWAPDGTVVAVARQTRLAGARALDNWSVARTDDVNLRLGTGWLAVDVGPRGDDPVVQVLLGLTTPVS